jgi:hypothetical protein
MLKCPGERFLGNVFCIRMPATKLVRKEFQKAWTKPPRKLGA